MNPPWSYKLPEGPWETTTLIGGRCRACKRYSRAVLRAREAWPVSFGRAISPTGPTIRGRAGLASSSNVTNTQLPDPGLFMAGGYGAGDPPDPIPNSEVKTRCADGTAGATRWESTAPPAYHSNARFDQ